MTVKRMDGILTYLKTRADSKWLVGDNLSKCSRKFTKKSGYLAELMYSIKKLGIMKTFY